MARRDHPSYLKLAVGLDPAKEDNEALVIAHIEQGGKVVQYLFGADASFDHLHTSKAHERYHISHVWDADLELLECHRVPWDMVTTGPTAA